MTTIADTEFLRAKRLRAALESLPEDRPLDLRRANEKVWPRSYARAATRSQMRAACDNDDDLFDNVPV